MKITVCNIVLIFGQAMGLKLSVILLCSILRAVFIRFEILKLNSRSFVSYSCQLHVFPRPLGVKLISSRPQLIVRHGCYFIKVWILHYDEQFHVYQIIYQIIVCILHVAADRTSFDVSSEESRVTAPVTSPGWDIYIISGLHPLLFRSALLPTHWNLTSSLHVNL